ncbi:MAG: proline iminopeptidase-family hydrolase [Candidatus Omnitrophota bacterium]
MPPANEGYVRVTGGKIWYKIVGKRKNKPPLLTLHGGPGAPHDYLEPLAALSDERPVIFYDQLGCGLSEKPRDKKLWTIERFVEELSQLQKALKIKAFHLLGVSWGSMLAVCYIARKHPDNILSLTLSGPYLNSALWDKDQRRYIQALPEEVKRVILDCEARESCDSPQYRQAMEIYYKKHVCNLDPWPACLKRALKKFNQDIYGYMWGPSEFTIRGTLKDADATPLLKNIRIPALLTCGRWDEASPETTRIYRDLLPNSRMVIFEGATHSHYLEKKNEYLDLLRVFLMSTEKDNNLLNERKIK